MVTDAILGETIPIRLFLGGFDLTPTFREVNKKYSTRYYLSLVLIDEGQCPIILFVPDGSYHHVLLRLEALSSWLRHSRPLVSASRVNSPHLNHPQISASFKSFIISSVCMMTAALTDSQMLVATSSNQRLCYTGKHPNIPLSSQWTHRALVENCQLRLHQHPPK